MSASTAELGGIISKFTADYKKATPLKLKLIDAYLTYCFFTGVIQVKSYTTIYKLRLRSLSADINDDFVSFLSHFSS